MHFRKIKKYPHYLILPIYKNKNNLKFIKNKKKIVSNFWPYIPPQSCIAIKREEFEKIINKDKF